MHQSDISRRELNPSLKSGRRSIRRGVRSLLTRLGLGKSRWRFAGAADGIFNVKAYGAAWRRLKKTTRERRQCDCAVRPKGSSSTSLLV